MSTKTHAPFDPIRPILNRDRIWSAYAIMDLQPSFQPLCQWGVAESSDGSAVALLFVGLTPPILVTTGEVEPLRQAIAQISLPDEIYISARLEHFPLLAEQFDFAHTAHEMQRMKFVDGSKVAMPTLTNMRRLVLGDAPMLKRLYAHGGEFAPDFFEAYQLEEGVYFGIADEKGEWVAAGGTHIVDRTEKIAAIGNIYTRADQRGNGFASAIFQAIVTTLVAEGFVDIFLNVDLGNHGAHRIYLRHGFVDYCRYMEGTGVKRSVNG